MSSEQTSLEKSASERVSQDLLFILKFREGLLFFNQESFFQAHEAWELPWKFLRQDSLAIFLQSYIYGCAHFIHVQKDRLDAALLAGEKAMAILKEPLPKTPDSSLSRLMMREIQKIDWAPLVFALDYNTKLLQDYQGPRPLNPELLIKPKLIGSL